jgi:uncharacterized membrane protein
VTEFLIALAVFLLSHSLPARPSIRARFVAIMGERRYLIAYSTLSLLLLAWLLRAAARAPWIPIWDPAIGQYWAPIVIMPASLLLLAGGFLCPNPLSVNFSRSRFDPARPGIVGVTRHPILWGFALWAFAHVVPNGDVVSLIMFGGFGGFALAAMKLIDRRKRRALGEAWAPLAARTSILPFAAAISGRARLGWQRSQLVGTILLAAGLYLLLLWLHPFLFGPDPKIAFG